MNAPEKYRRRLSILETVALCVVVIAITIAIMNAVHFERMRPHAFFSGAGLSEFQALAQKYGPNRFSRNAEEWIIRDYFQDKRNGVFLDVGANHYQLESNT